MNKKSDVLELDLVRMIGAVFSKFWLILISGLLAAVLFLGYAKVGMTPMYSANALFCVNNPNGGSFSTSQLMAAQYLADTYMVILESRSVLDTVSEQTGLPYTHKELASMVSSASVNDTEVFRVTVTCPNPEHAAQIANAIVRVLPEKIAAAQPGSSMYVVDEAVVNREKVSPSYSKMLLLGFVAGAVLCALAVIVVDLLDDSIRSEDYLQRNYSDVPLLAVIPEGETGKGGYYTSFSQKKKAKPAGGKQ